MNFLLEQVLEYLLDAIHHLLFQGELLLLGLWSLIVEANLFVILRFSRGNFLLPETTGLTPTLAMNDLEQRRLAFLKPA